MGTAVKFSAKRICAFVVLLVSLGSLALLTCVSFSGRMDAMLPEKEGIKDIFSFLKDVQVSDKVLVTLSMRDGSADADILSAAAQQYIAQLDTKLVSPMTTGFQQGEIAQDFKRLVQQLPEYTERGEFEEIAAITSYPGVSTSLSNLVKRLQTPEGMFSGSSARSDPLDWNGRLVKKMVGLLSSFGYRAVPVQGRLMDPEHKNLLLVLQTPISLMDIQGVRALVTHLEACAKSLPPGVETSLVCAHLHTLGNETIIRRDIQVTSISAVFVFCILFFVVYRDWRAGYMVLLPFLATLPALAASALIFKNFSAFVVGFGATITGITDDYCVQAYVFSRTRQREQNLKRIRLPVFISALTTLCLFLAFCFSSIPAYQQLGCFAALSVIVAFIYALVVLPRFIPVPKDVDSIAEQAGETVSRHRFRPRTAWLVIGCSGVAFGLGILALFNLRFDANVSKLDGTPAAVLAAEQRAVQVWGGGESHAAILSVEAPTEEEALRLNDELYTALLKAGIPAQDVSSLAPLFPSEATRQQRRKQWMDYWNGERVQAFRENVRQASAAMEFSDDAFGAFWSLFEMWRTEKSTPSEPVAFLQPLRERFIHVVKTADPVGQTVRVTTFLPDDPQVLALAGGVKAEIPSLKIVSRQTFAKQLSSAFTQEISFISKLAGGFIILLTVFLIRRPGMIALAVLPSIAGLLWGCAAMVFLGRSLDVSNLIAGIMVLGLCIDYGICMVFAYRDGIQENSFRALTLSAVTTIMGAGVLLLAKHPALFSIGVTLVSGISAGYLCACLTLRAVYSLTPVETKDAQ